MQMDKLINDEYKVWKKNTPFLYDMVLTYALEWPSLTFSWLPFVTKAEATRSNVHRVVLGTHAMNEQNYLMLADVTLPETDMTIDSSMETDEKDQYGGFGNASGRFEIDIRICHDGEVNRARYMPQNPCVIATKSPHPDVFIFDYTRHPSKPDLKKGCQPDLRLKGHSKEGYGVCWNSRSEGRVVSSSDDGSICYWDIGAAPSHEKSLNPVATYNSSMGVEDVCWHRFHPDIFVSVADDSTITVWDTRQPSKTPSQSIVGHSGEIYSVSLSPFSENVFATGGSDSVVKIWDFRHLSSGSVHELVHHKSDVIQLEWSPHRETMLASSSTDRRVNIWDLSRIGVDPTNEDLLDGPAELIFVHGGHTSKLTDMAWNLNEPLLVGTVSDDNIVQFWKMIYGVEFDDNGDGNSATKRAEPEPIQPPAKGPTALDNHPSKVPKV